MEFENTFQESCKVYVGLLITEYLDIGLPLSTLTIDYHLVNWPGLNSYALETYSPEDSIESATYTSV